MAYSDDADTIGLYHLEGGDADDSSSFSNDGTQTGMNVKVDAVFGFGFESDGGADRINLDVISGDFDDAEGTFEFWIISATAGQWSDGSLHYLGILRVDGTNEIRIFKSVGDDTFLHYVAGGSTDGVTIAGFDPGVLPTHMAIQWSVANDEVKAFINGVQVGTTQTVLGTWVGAVAAARVANNSTDTVSFLGIYDEIRISTVPRETYDVFPDPDPVLVGLFDNTRTARAEDTIGTQPTLLVE